MSADNKKVVSNENLAAFAEALAAKVPLKSDIPTKVSDLQNDLGFTDKPGTITSVTLNGTTTSSGGVDLGYLVVQEGGKGLSSNDYTSLEKSKLGGIESGAQVNTIETISVNETVITPVNKTVEITVPTMLSDLQNDSGFTSNTGTITGITMNGASKGTSGVVDLGTVITSESDPVFSASAASGITSSDITNWNSKTSNTGTLTGVKVNGSNVTVTDGIADVGTIITSHQDIKTINNQTITGTGNVTLNTLPSVSSSDNGKILQVVNGAWALVTPSSLYSGTETPSNSLGNNGDIYLQT